MSDHWIDIGSREDLPPMSARTVQIDGRDDIAVFRTANGSFYALVNKCPHKNGPLSQGIVHDTTVTCPLHNWRISLVNGEAQGEDKGCVPTIPVRVDGDRILLSLPTTLSAIEEAA